jgi:hypothetical protein
MGKRAKNSNQVTAELISKIIHDSATALTAGQDFLFLFVPENDGSINEKLKKTPPGLLAGSEIRKKPDQHLHRNQ